MKLEFNYNLWYNDETQSTEIAFFLGDNSAEACVSIPLHSLILDTITSEIEYAKKGREDYTPWMHRNDMENCKKIVEKIRQCADEYEELLTQFTTKSEYDYDSTKSNSL